MSILGEIFFITQDNLAALVPDLAQTPNVEFPYFNEGTGQWETLLFIHLVEFGVFYIGPVAYDTAPLEISFPYADYWLPQISHPVAVYPINYPGTNIPGEYVTAVVQD